MRGGGAGVIRTLPVARRVDHPQRERPRWRSTRNLHATLGQGPISTPSPQVCRRRPRDVPLACAGTSGSWNSVVTRTVYLGNRPERSPSMARPAEIADRGELQRRRLRFRRPRTAVECPPPRPGMPEDVDQPMWIKKNPVDHSVDVSSDHCPYPFNSRTHIEARGSPRPRRGWHANPSKRGSTRVNVS